MSVNWVGDSIIPDTPSWFTGTIGEWIDMVHLTTATTTTTNATTTYGDYNNTGNIPTWATTIVSPSYILNPTPQPQQELLVSKKIKKGTHLVVRKRDGITVSIEDSYEDAMDEARERATTEEIEYVVFAAKKSVRPKPDDLEERDAS